MVGSSVEFPLCIGRRHTRVAVLMLIVDELIDGTFDV